MLRFEPTAIVLLVVGTAFSTWCQWRLERKLDVIIDALARARGDASPVEHGHAWTGRRR